MRVKAIAGKLDGTENEISSLIGQAGKDAAEISHIDDFNARVAAMFGNIKLTNDGMMAIAQTHPDVFQDVHFRPVMLEMAQTRLIKYMNFRDQIIHMQEQELEAETPAAHREIPRSESLRPI